MLKKVSIFISLVALASCNEMEQQRLKRQTSEKRTYHIALYSGGNMVFMDSFYGILNNSEHSDGYYYYKGDSLIEVSGDCVIKSVE
jgi:hypothetical protein